MSINKFVNQIDDVKFLICRYLSFDDIKKLRKHQQLYRRLLFQHDGYMFKYLYERDFGYVKHKKTYYDNYYDILQYCAPYTKHKLHKASSKGLINLVATYIKAKYNVNEFVYPIGTPLTKAIEGNHLDIVKFLVDNKANINYNNGDYLRVACFVNKPNIVQYLIDQNLDPHIDDDSLLMYSIKNNYHRVANILINNKKPNHQYSNQTLEILKSFKSSKISKTTTEGSCDQM